MKAAPSLNAISTEIFYVEREHDANLQLFSGHNDLSIRKILHIEYPGTQVELTISFVGSFFVSLGRFW